MNQKRIEGVRLKNLRHVVKEQGHLTEIFRRNWTLDERPVEQVFQVTLMPGQITAWHAHQYTLDRLFVNLGTIKIVLFDGRPESPSRGLVNEFKMGLLRPSLLVIPPQVWHGVQNIGSEQGQIINLVDRAYQYTDPDHWRLPQDSPSVPYQWRADAAG